MVEWSQCHVVSVCGTSSSLVISANLKFIVFMKNKYEEEERGFPEFLKAIIAMVIIGGMFVFAWKIGERSTEKDMEFQYQDQMVKVD